MSHALKTLAQGTLTNAKATLYTPSGATTALVSFIAVYNTAVTAETVLLYIKKSGGSSTEFDRVVLNQDEHGEQTKTFPLGNGDLIEGQSTNNSAVKFTIQGDEVG